MATKSYRVHTNVGSDTLLNVQLKQDADVYEMLSLQLKQSDAYKLHTSNYGVIVGRVLANNAFGIPNAKVSVFVEISSTDASRSDLTKLYSYSSTQDVNDDNIKYNLLPNESSDDCYAVVGTFPSKRMVLDNDAYIEVYDKYYKYTTVTNKSGDYMIFGVPTGSCQVHVDLDLSDIGVLSQKPRDFIYKGYNINQFESGNQFKTSENLNSLPQIFTQDVTCTVYPFWGDGNVSEVAVTRKDIAVDYDFETTCVFLGSVITDNGNSIRHDCTIDKNLGVASQLTTGKGTIEMIRKTQFGTVEEKSIQGNELIDSNGTWCYQIPMNLDYVGMDEYGNIVPTNDSTKGIATRAKVRFRISLDSITNGEATTTHTAKYLVPNNPSLNGEFVMPVLGDVKTVYRRLPFFTWRKQENKVTGNTTDMYEFGSKTPDDCFRDLYWNKVYTVKNYIPRVQKGTNKYNTAYFTGLKCVNGQGAKSNNLIPYNHISFNYVKDAFNTTDDSGLETFYNNENLSDEDKKMLRLADNFERYDVISLDFYNDWLNGVLYFPLWYWRRFKKSRTEKGEILYTSVFCDCSEDSSKKNSNLKLVPTCSIGYTLDGSLSGNVSNELVEKNNLQALYSAMGLFTDTLSNGYLNMRNGIITNVRNKDNIDLYYYSHGSVEKSSQTKSTEYVYARLFSTDIVLLGSLLDNDYDGIPKMSSDYPRSTCNIPDVLSYKTSYVTESDEIYGDSGGTSNTIESKDYTVTGMMYKAQGITNTETMSSEMKGGLFVGIRPNTDSIFDKFAFITNTKLITSYKSCINLERICELSVSQDSDMSGMTEFTDSNGISYSKGNITADGYITSQEIDGHDLRSQFASMNHNKLVGIVLDKSTGYLKYNIDYLYVDNFDGKLRGFLTATNEDSIIKDKISNDYVKFRYGSSTNTRTKYHLEDSNYLYDGKRMHFYYVNNDKYYFPLFDNSFYFYFGLNAKDTAIDTFYDTYYGNCSQDEEYDFTISLSGHSDYACLTTCQKNSSVGTGSYIDIETNGANLPYKYTVTNNSTNIIIKSDFSDSGSSLTRVYVDNGTYTVSVTDTVVEKTVTDSITLIYEPISASVSKKDLTINYYSGVTNKKQVCDKNNEYYGLISLKTIKLYGEQYYVEAEASQEDGVFNFKAYPVNTTSTGCTNKSDNMRQISVSILKDGAAFSDCSCDGSDGTVSQYELKDNGQSIQYRIFRPGNYTVTLTEKCYDDDLKQEVETNNTTSYNVVINDIEDFKMNINGVNSSYLLGFVSDYKNYNENFYKNGSISSPTELKGWFNLDNESVYKFPSVSESSDIWADLVDGVTLNNVLTEKFNAYMNLIKSVYITTGNTIPEVSCSGEGEPYLLRNAINTYDETDYTEGEFNKMKINNDEIKYTSIINPNIVSYNYKYTNNSGNIVSPTETSFNPKYKDKNYCFSYFASFTENAGIVSTGNTCTTDSSISYQSIPFNAYSLECYDTEERFDDLFDKIVNGDTTYNSYLRIPTIDRRLDYDIMIYSPYDGSLTDDGSESWTKGRISGVTYNGIDMSYDSNKNILSDSKGKNNEYTYTSNGYNDSDALTAASITRNESSQPKFYECTLQYGTAKKTDLANAFWSKYNTENSVSPTAGSLSIVNHMNDTKANFNGKFNESNYPTVRLLDITDIPYSDEYTLTLKTCSYDGLTLETDSNGNLACYAKEGEELSINVKHNDLVISTGISTTNGDYNVGYKYYQNGSNADFSASTFTMGFKLNANDNNENFYVKTQVPRLLIDDSNFTFIKKIKENVDLAYYQIITGNSKNTTLVSYTGDKADSQLYFPFYDEDTKSKRINYYVDNVDIEGQSIVGVLLDRKYMPRTENSLTHGLRVINISNLYSVKGVSVGVDTYMNPYVYNGISYYGNFILNKPTGNVQYTCFNISGDIVSNLISLYVTIEIDENTYSKTYNSMKVVTNDDKTVKSFLIEWSNMDNYTLYGNSAKITAYMTVDSLVYKMEFKLENDQVIHSPS